MLPLKVEFGASISRFTEGLAIVVIRALLTFIHVFQSDSNFRSLLFIAPLPLVQSLLSSPLLHGVMLALLRLELLVPEIRTPLHQGSVTCGLFELHSQARIVLLPNCRTSTVRLQLYLAMCILTTGK